MSTENITLVIRLGTSIRFTLPSSASNNTITVNSTIQDVKALIALEETCDRCPVERQRLIYKGRILSDNSRTLSDYGVAGDNQTLHLVKGSAPRSTAPAPSPAPTQSTPSPATSAPAFTPPMGGGGAGNNAGFFNMMQNMMQQNNGTPPDMGAMQQQLLQNPEMMSSLMQSPMMQSMMSNPDVIRTMMESNPEMRRVMDSNPQLRHILDDPELMRRSMEMMRDPSAMQNMMRNQDLAMSQIENVPGGFNALRRMYEEVQEPMMDAMSGSGARDDNTESTSASTTGGAMPNPWGAPSTNATTTPNPASTNPWGGTPSSSGASSTPPMFGAMPGVPAQRPGGGPADLEQTINMLENPMINQMMQQMLNDPAAMQTMMDNNPMLAQMRQQNPAAAAMMSNPETLRSMMDPTNLRALSQIQGAMQTLQGNGMSMPGMPPIPDMGGASGAAGQGGNNPALDFSGLLSSFQNANLGTAHPMAPAMTQMQPPEERFSNQLASLNDMGFNDRAANIQALVACHGNVNRAVEMLLGGLS